MGSLYFDTMTNKLADPPYGGISLQIPIKQRSAMKIIATRRNMQVSDLHREIITAFLDGREVEVPCANCDAVQRIYDAH